MGKINYQNRHDWTEYTQPIMNILQEGPLGIGMILTRVGVISRREEEAAREAIMMLEERRAIDRDSRGRYRIKRGIRRFWDKGAGRDPRRFVPRGRRNPPMTKLDAMERAREKGVKYIVQVRTTDQKIGWIASRLSGFEWWNLDEDTWRKVGVADVIAQITVDTEDLVDDFGPMPNPRRFVPRGRRNPHLSPKEIIRQQIGPQVLAEVGASNFVGSDSPPMLMFRVRPMGKRGLFKIRIVLDPSDTYTVELWKVNARTAEATVLESQDMVYADVLGQVVSYLVTS